MNTSIVKHNERRRSPACLKLCTVFWYVIVRVVRSIRECGFMRHSVYHCIRTRSLVMRICLPVCTESNICLHCEPLFLPVPCTLPCVWSVSLSEFKGTIGRCRIIVT